MNREPTESLIRRLALEPLPEEGGWFRRVYTGRPDASGRPAMTAIYALFADEQFSALHRLDADELFCFHAGDPFEALELRPDGSAAEPILGPDPALGQHPQIAFPAGVWFGGRPAPGAPAGYTLMSCVVTPGFEWRGFELGGREPLAARYPARAARIAELTRG